MFASPSTSTHKACFDRAKRDHSMKLLIIAGPYEADRIRKAAVSAGFETVAVEPGESMSGWITASRPELIVVAQQRVHTGAAAALAKVRLYRLRHVQLFLLGGGG